MASKSSAAADLRPTRGYLLAMPILVLNVGAEMVYILEQRLKAQSIAADKAKKVLADVIKTMLAPKFMAELFRPQEPHSMRAVRALFDRVAHSSIMRLNKGSMDKLFDLMVMGVKHQVVTVTHASYLLDVTLNHLDALRAIVDSSAVAPLVDAAIAAVTSTYRSLPLSELQALRCTLMRVLQDRRVKVSLFLQDHAQNNDGSFVLRVDAALPPGVKPPGSITYFNSSGAVVNTATVAPLVIAGAVTTPETSPFGPERACKLGGNMYAKERRKGGGDGKGGQADDTGTGISSTADGKADILAVSSPAESSSAAGGGSGSDSKLRDEDDVPSSSSKAQVNLLAALMGVATGRGAAEGKEADEEGTGTFPLALFDETSEASSADSSSGGKAVVVSPVRQGAGTVASQRDMLQRLGFDDVGSDSKSAGAALEEGKGEEEEDLLALMDGV